MVDTCHVEVLSATAVPKCARGTRFGSSACPGRHGERAGDAEQHHHGEHRPRGIETARRERQQQQCAQALEREARGEDAAAVEAVRDVARRQHQQHERQELRQPDQTEVERIARDRVDLPADRHGLHLHRERREEARREEEREVAIA